MSEQGIKLKNVKNINSLVGEHVMLILQLTIVSYYAFLSQVA